MTKKRKIFSGAAALIAAGAILILTGCIDVETNVFVEKDGSGRVEQRMMMKSEFVAMIGSMKGDENYSLLNEEELKGKSADLGEGVTFRSADPETRGGFTGYTVVYDFEDIEKLRLNQNPGDDLPDEASEGEAVRELVRFSFDEGRNPVLTILLPSVEDEGGTASASGNGGSMPEEAQTEFIEAFNQMYKDMRMVMTVTVDGRIRSTNATYREGSTVTLMEIDFSKIADSPERIRELAGANPETTEELKAFMREIPGMKGEMQEEVRIEFR